MDAFQRTLFPGSGDSVDDDACSVYTLETGQPRHLGNTSSGPHPSQRRLGLPR